MIKNKLFSEKELELLGSAAFFELKNQVTHKLKAVFGEVNESLAAIADTQKAILPEPVLFPKGKISSGENYLGYPWMVLDYPRFFEKENVFAYRSMCWWGNHFSFTLHIGGKYYAGIKSGLAAKLETANDDAVYICVNESPWHYHFENNNYITLQAFNLKSLRERNELLAKSFLKLSRKIELHEAEKVKQVACESFLKLISLV